MKDSKRGKGQLLQIPCSRGEVLEKIRAIANDPECDKVEYLDHAVMRMQERDFTIRQVQRVLREGSLKTGDISKDVTWDSSKEPGWRCRMQSIVAGVRITVTAKLVIRGQESCLVITVH